MKYFVIAGEASGDLHASNLIKEIGKIDSQAVFCGLGGDLMEQQGVALVKHYRQMAFMGFVAVLKNIRTIWSNLDECKLAISKFEPDVVILVDYPSFNLRIAKFVKKYFSSKVYYYISPKLWAWKEYRIRSIKKYIDEMFTIFPFETDFYAKHHYDVNYIGNPTVDYIQKKMEESQTFDEFVESNQLNNRPIIALLAGSRKQEIDSCLSRMLEAASSFEDYQLVLAGAPGIEPTYYESFLKGKKVTVASGQTYQLLKHAAIAIVNSGTATLETALIGTPQIVVYHIGFGRLGYLAKNIFIKTSYISLVNIIAGRELVKELIAHLFTVDGLKEEMNKILNDEVYRSKMKEGYLQIKEVLGDPGAAERGAKMILEKLKR